MKFKVYLPFIFRYTTEKYTSVRMVERKLLNRFVTTRHIFNFICIFVLSGFFKFFPRRLTLAHVLGPIISQVNISITRSSIIKISFADSESKLLNEINLKHTDCSYGKEAFTSKDLVVRLKDAKEFHKFLDLCHKKLVLKKSNASDRCGFFRWGMTFPFLC